MKCGFSIVFDSDVNCKKKRTKRIPYLINLPVILAGALTAALAQDNAATISGVVTDPNGTVVAGAQVSSTPTRSREKRRTVTDSRGGYTFPNLAPGLYRIEVVANGFAVSEMRGGGDRCDGIGVSNGWRFAGNRAIARLPAAAHSRAQASF